MRPFVSSAMFNARRDSREGFTLLELLLVLAIMVAVGSMAMPIMTQFMRGPKLKAAADQVRAEWSAARNLAMEKARPYLFRYQLESGAYIVQPWSGADAEANASTEAAAPNRDPPALPNGRERPHREKSLPERIVFRIGATSSDTRSQKLLNSDDGNPNGSPSSATPILFYEDGSTSDARVILVDDRDMSIVLELRGLNGTGKASEIMPFSEAVQ